MPFDHIAQISAWLMEAGIDDLELRGPDRQLRLRAARADHSDDAIPPADLAEAEFRAPHFTVKAPSAGILLHRHPMQDKPLAPCGSRIRAGQTMALLQIGALLLPVEAPRDGTVTRLLAEHGALVGYGSQIIELSATAAEHQHEH
jgi:acetyl-CoA carboxylase biotin carboxyl carrier protein